MFWQFQKPVNENWCSINGIFSPPEIAAILAIKDDLEAQTAQIGSGIVNPEIRNSKIRWINPAPHTEWLFDRLEGSVQQLNNQYFRLNLTGFTPLQLTEYSEGGEFYSAHTDKGNGNDRKLSISVQLTDPSNYEGGDLLLYPSNLKPVATPKELGTINVFRSHIIHEVTPVTKGTRFSLVGWVSGPDLC